MEHESHQFRPNQSRSLTDLRTPIVDNFLSMLPIGHEKAFKYALYNTVALLLAAAVIVAFWGVYCILENFIRPLMWATLCGSVLHPFKEQLCSLARTWLRNAKKSSAPFTLEVMITPLKVTDSVSDKIGTHIWMYWKSIVMGIVGFFATYILYYNPPVTVVGAIQYIVSTSFTMVIWILSWINGPVVLALNIGYLAATLQCATSRIQTRTSNDAVDGQDELTPTQSSNQVPESYKYNLKVLSYAAWSVTFIYICLRLPYPFLFALAIFLGMGTVSYLRKQRQKSSFRYTLPTISRMACMMVLNIGNEGNQRRDRSTSQIMSPIANLFERTMKNSPSTSEKFTPSESSPKGRTVNKDEKLPLHRSFSDSSAGMNPLIGGRRNEIDSLNSSVGEGDGLGTVEMPSPIFTPASIIEDEVDGHGIDSNKFLSGVFCVCLVVFVWSRLWLMHLIPIPIVYYGVKKLSSRFGAMKYLDEKVKQPIRNFYFGSDEYSTLLIPEPVRVIFRIMYAADRKMISICEAYVDPVASILVLVLVVMATIVGLLFAATQVYAEGDHLVRVAGNLINRTVSDHPEINQFLPAGWQSVMNSMVDNAYISGREYITNMIRDSISEADPKKAEQIEKQVIELWDRIYLAWNQTWENAFTNVTKIHHIEHDGLSEHQGIEWNELLETGNLVELSVLANYAKANLGTVFSITESIWKILLGNISLAVSAITSILSLLFGGGTAILNLMMNMVVFFTALFYLLSSSTSVYKPVEIFNRWSPGSGVHSNRFAIAVEEAVSGVFAASFKMGAFYGMWTWLVHTLFQVNIVFVPSLLGGLFAAVPFLAPYWAAVPAVLECWLIQGHWPKALCMLLAQMAPMSAVDTQIYSEIKGGGHPYLTGLAVAGGIFYFGFQGAIIGPILLCLVFVTPDLIKVGNSYMWEGSPTEMLIQNQQRQLNRRPREFGDTTDNGNQSSSRQ